jgi:hypothetical protein
MNTYLCRVRDFVGRWDQRYLQARDENEGVLLCMARWGAPERISLILGVEPAHRDCLTEKEVV